MAGASWGNVYFKDTYAGRLQEDPGGRHIFAYDDSYLESGQPAIAHTLPLRHEPYVSERGLHSFFDNLVAEGWFRDAQGGRLASIHATGLACYSGSDVISQVRYPLLTRSQLNTGSQTMQMKQSSPH